MDAMLETFKYGDSNRLLKLRIYLVINVSLYITFGLKRSKKNDDFCNYVADALFGKCIKALATMTALMSHIYITIYRYLDTQIEFSYNTRPTTTGQSTLNYKSSKNTITYNILYYGKNNILYKLHLYKQIRKILKIHIYTHRCVNNPEESYYLM